MVTFSLCLIVKNEEHVLKRCLSSVEGIFEEIIVVDTGSTDSTKEIAGQFTSQIYDFEWCNDFARARNFSFSKAKMDYTMWLDADDVVTVENRKRLLDLKKTLLPEIDVVMMRYDTAFDFDGRPTFFYYRERLLKTSRKFKWAGAVHEVIQPAGNILFSSISIEHRKTRFSEPGRNLGIYEKLLAQGVALDQRQKYYYARELMYSKKYKEAAETFLDFLNGRGGSLEDRISACRDLAFCYYFLGNEEAAFLSLLRSFSYDRPRAEICCALGQHFLDREQYDLAIYWYQTAFGSEIPDKTFGFVQPDYYGYIPALQLCICCDRLGELEKASSWNEKAGEFKPNDPAYLYNKSYFQSKKAALNWK
ncbi:MAG: glycosyltransferase family 2 protein [Firmicutes bacterium]|nr:glycosyltransferase family 2 protein [Bacillota bacterium]